jgi:dihydropteroate synthase
VKIHRLRLALKQTQRRILRARRHKFDLSKRPLIMGVLNITPDSFSDGGDYLDINKACKRAMEIESQGADIIDIGGESARPGALPVCLDDEINRVIPVIKRLRNRIKIPVSVDTTKYEVAAAALKEGASIVNDISGLHADKRLAKICAKYSAAVIIMHKKGTPSDMQKNPCYTDLLNDIVAYLKNGIKVALASGLKKENIIVDPGIGFGKNIKHNLSIIKNISLFKKTGYPVMIGLSRKSFLGSITNLQTHHRLIPTAIANALAIYNGADIVRVHDIRESALALNIAEALKKA